MPDIFMNSGGVTVSQKTVAHDSGKKNWQFLHHKMVAGARDMVLEAVANEVVTGRLRQTRSIRPVKRN